MPRVRYGSVAIVGGGVAGLSAAQELIERGFEVTVYERRAYFGGKAASTRQYKNQNDQQDAPLAEEAAALARRRPPVWNCAPCDGDVGLPGEHGFRFFPGWYRHLTDTMSRIPYHKAGGGRRSVADNLVSIQANLLAWFDRPPVALPLQLPRTAADVAMASEFVAQFTRLGLSSAEVALFWGKLLEIAAMSDERRVEALEGVSWWQFCECDAPERSRAYRDFIRATTRTSVAAKAEEVSAYTVGRLAIRSLLDTVSEVDRVLNGPTNEVWFDPWIAHLKARGVRFETEMELDAIVFAQDARRVEHLCFEPVPLANARRLRTRLEGALRARPPLADLSPDQLRKRIEDFDELTGALGTANRLGANGDKVRQHLEAYLCAEADRNELANKGWRQRLADLVQALGELESDPTYPLKVTVDHFVLALPLEQVAYYVDRSTMSTFLAPELRDLVRLSRYMDWMAGIQFYLREPLDLASGHLIGLDSSWALTAIEQTQFWRDVVLPSEVAAVLSVDISAWDQKGRIVRKEAFNCSDDEIARETWGQLKEMLNKSDRLPVLSDEMLIGAQPNGPTFRRGINYHLDDSVVDLKDRKKQAFYERARGVEFDTLDLITQDDGQGQRNAVGKTDDAYAWGPRLRFNAEPLLLNRPGSRALRPDASTSIPNLFLAGDYLKTETDLACMEGANEAARRAVNAILDAEAAREPRCQLWSFSPPRQAVEALLSTSGVLRAARGVGTVAVQLQDQLWKRLALGIMRVQGGSASRPERLPPTTLDKRY